jgi:hypothetical protein
MTLSLTTFSIMDFNATLSIKLHSVQALRGIMLNVAFSYCYAEPSDAKCRYAECRGALKQ